jgi:hypothetical protein
MTTNNYIKFLLVNNDILSSNLIMFSFKSQYS